MTTSIVSRSDAIRPTSCSAGRLQRSSGSAGWIAYPPCPSKARRHGRSRRGRRSDWPVRRRQALGSGERSSPGRRPVSSGKSGPTDRMPRRSHSMIPATTRSRSHGRKASSESSRSATVIPRLIRLAGHSSPDRTSSRVGEGRRRSRRRRPGPTVVVAQAPTAGGSPRRTSWIEGVAILAGSPHPDRARLFLQFLGDAHHAESDSTSTGESRRLGGPPRGIAGCDLGQRPG